MIINEEIQIVKKNNGNATSLGQKGTGHSKPLIESALRLL
jgi:hypothetical protein